jgi:Fur family ferric uptake transcriptional regulator
MPDVATALARLEKAGYRLTGQRRTVLEEIVRRTVPFTSADLWATIQERAPGIGRATVFRTLDLVTRLGVVQRIHDDPEGGRCHAYLACEPTHHHHLICNGCGSVTDFADDPTLEALVRAVEQRTAFRVEGHRLELLGRCPACQAAGSASTA